MMIRFAIIMGLVLVTACGPSATETEKATVVNPDVALIEKAGAPLFEGMGNFSLKISTKDEGAQRYFDQAMVLAFAFNHAESIRSFRAAQKLDPSCAMCFWGEALASGPNINVTSNGRAIMSAADRVSAHKAAQHAINLMAGATEIEQDYILAQATRFNGDASTPREPLDVAYAAAMEAVSNKYPDDNNAASMFAEALMNTMPWNYWADDGDPKPDTIKVIGKLEAVIQDQPDHPLALHLYIHTVEASSNAGRAEAAADLLSDLVPGAGHLVHMPAHIYWRVGRYFDASEANIEAAAVDEAYIAQCNAQGFYPALYYPHNIHFLWAASTMEGRSELSIESAIKVANNVSLEQIKQFPTVEFFQTIPLLSYVRFGKWDEILDSPEPPDHLAYSRGIWHYARGVALTQTGEMALAKQQHASIKPLSENMSISFLDERDYPASLLLSIADDLLLGEIALKENDHKGAIAHFKAAVDLQDTLSYTEPPFWYYPTRQSLGYALLQAGRSEAAADVYRQDLEAYPRNGWSMFGLAQALEADGKTGEAAEIKERFEEVWQMADVSLTASRIE